MLGAETTLCPSSSCSMRIQDSGCCFWNSRTSTGPPVCCMCGTRRRRASGRRAARNGGFRSMRRRCTRSTRCFGRNMRTSDYIFHQANGSPWKSILESFRSLLKRCEFKRSGVHILRHTFGAHLAQKGVDMAVIRDRLGHHSVTLTEKYYAHLAPSNLTSAVNRLHKENLLPKTLPKTVFAPVSGIKNCEAEVPLSVAAKKEAILTEERSHRQVPLTDSFERCYVPEVALLAGVAKLAYAADSESEPCFFCSLRNASQLLESKQENVNDALSSRRCRHF